MHFHHMVKVRFKEKRWAPSCLRFLERLVNSKRTNGRKIVPNGRYGVQNEALS